MFGKHKKCSCDGHYHHTFIKHILLGAMTLLFIVLTIFVIYKIRNEARAYTYIGRADVPVNTILVQGVGKVTAEPDLALVSLGVETQAETVSKAQKDNTTKMNAIVVAIKDMGVADSDIKTTSYNIWPNYDYNKDTGASKIIGYRVNQSVEVKVRDLDSVGEILSKAGDLGANQVGGINFTIDEPEGLKSQARENAINDAKTKAGVLFDSIGVKAGRIVGFNETTPGQYYPYYAETALYDSKGIGGGAPAPSIETGTQEVEVTVNLIYELQ